MLHASGMKVQEYTRANTPGIYQTSYPLRSKMILGPVIVDSNFANLLVFSLKAHPGFLTILKVLMRDNTGLAFPLYLR